MAPTAVRPASSAHPVPGPRGWPYFGSLPAFARDPLAFLDRMAGTYGDLSTFRLGPFPCYLVIHPDQVEQVLVKSWRSLHKDAIYGELRDLLGRGLVTSEDDLWKRQRRLIAPSFQPRHLEVYARTMADLSEDAAGRFSDGEVRDIHADMMRLTLEIVLATLFGPEAKVDPGAVEENIAAYMDGFVAVSHGPSAAVPRWVPTPARRRKARAVEALDALLMPVIQERRASGIERDDLLGRLLAAQDDDGSGMTETQLRDEAITLFVAGHETTALALTYAVVLLSQHPEARDRLEAEVDEVLGDRPATLEDLPRLTWARAAIDEAMRVYPPVWAVGREAQEDIEVDGVAIPAGSQIMLAQWVNHHDPRWFEEPSAFRPERWLDGLDKRLPRFAYFPFGGGPRVCIGNHFALMEATLALATMARHATLEWTGEPLRLLPSVTLRPRDPVRVRVTRRRPASRSR